MRVHPAGEVHKPMEFIVSKTDDILVSPAGLALAGALLQRTDLRQRLDAMAAVEYSHLSGYHGIERYFSRCMTPG